MGRRVKVTREISSLYHSLTPLGQRKVMPKSRLDLLLVSQGLFASREKAQRAILAGNVFINGQRIDKPGTQFAVESTVDVKQNERYVGRGGLKLEGALAGLRRRSHRPAPAWTSAHRPADSPTACSSTGPARVYALDVGHGQMDWKIRSDPRVVVREKFNARYLRRRDLPEPVCLVRDRRFVHLAHD